MVAWVVCACCSGGRGRRQQYRYEVVYRREESLYSGPDYLESLPGRTVRPPPPPPTAIQHPPTDPPSAGAPPVPPSALDTLSRQNRVNHFLTTLQSPPSPSNSNYNNSPRRAHWRSQSQLPPPHHPLLPSSRSVPYLALPPSSGFIALPSPGGPPPPVHGRDQSQSSRDLSRETSRDISLASSAQSTRPLLGLVHNNTRPLLALPSPPHRPPPPGAITEVRVARPRPPPLNPLPLGPSVVSGPPYSPHTPLSPGPPAYPHDISFTNIHNLSAGE